VSNKSLYVGNLPYTANERDVFDFFGDFDPQSVRIVEGKGFGFVDIPEDQMQACIDALNGKELGGRKLIINEARPKEPGRGDRFGGGGRDRH